MSGRVVVESPTFPYIIKPVWEIERPIRSVIKVSLDKRSRENYDLAERLGTQELFTVVGGDFHFSMDAGDGKIQVLHPWAGDDEGDTPRYALLTLDSPQPKHGWDGLQSWSAWLTGVEFYHSEADDPFNGLVRKTEPEEGQPMHGLRFLNSGHPYTPPTVRFRNVRLPRKVEIDIYSRSGDAWDEWVEKLVNP